MKTSQSPFRRAMLGSAAAGGLLLACAGPAAHAQDKIVLRVADSFPETHYVSRQLTVPWMNRVKELTNGRVDFRYFPGEQLAKSKDLLDAAKNRIADVTYVAPLYISDRLPLSGVVALPGLPGNASQKTAAYMSIVKSQLAEAEFRRESVVPILTVTVASYEIGMNGKRIDSLDAIKGRKIRSSGGLQEQSVRALGGSPTQIAAPELYAALERKTVDATISPLASLTPYGLHEVLKSITTNANLGTFPIAYVVNANVWSGLPADVRDAMTRAAQEVSKTFAAYVDDETQRATEDLKKRGLDLYALPPDIVQEFSRRAAPIGDEWAKRLDGRGLPASAVLKSWREELSR